jgi:5-formyltetrahydrofolate cyclo-ligase
LSEATTLNLTVQGPVDRGILGTLFTYLKISIYFYRHSYHYVYEGKALPIDATRRLIRSRRDEITDSAQAVAAEQLANRIILSSAYQNSQHIAVYWAVGGEISLQPLIRRAWQEGKQCYLPVIRRQSLVFVPYFEHAVMAKNVFGIPEPEVCDNILPAAELDLVLTPLVAFDSQCHRIGMGGGYYDRAFAFLNVQKEGRGLPPVAGGKRNNLSRPFLMGVSHGCQQVDVIHPESWDVALDGICTDLTEIKVD